MLDPHSRTFWVAISTSLCRLQRLYYLATLKSKLRPFQGRFRRQLSCMRHCIRATALAHLLSQPALLKEALPQTWARLEHLSRPKWPLQQGAAQWNKTLVRPSQLDMHAKQRGKVKLTCFPSLSINSQNPLGSLPLSAFQRPNLLAG